MYASPQEYLGTYIPTFFFLGGGRLFVFWRPKATLHTLPKLESAATDSDSQKHYFNYTWLCLTGEPLLTTPYKAAVLVRCRRLRSRDDPAQRCDAMTWEN